MDIYIFHLSIQCDMSSIVLRTYMNIYIIHICVAVEVVGVSTRVGHRSCTHAFLHVGTHKVITWALCSLYKD